MSKRVNFMLAKASSKRGKNDKLLHQREEFGYQAYQVLCEGSTKNVENYQNKIALKKLESRIKTLQDEHKRTESKLNGEKHALLAQYRGLLEKDGKSDTEGTFFFQPGFRYHRTGEQRHPLVEVESQDLRRAISDMNRTSIAKHIKLEKERKSLMESTANFDIQTEIKEIEAGLKDILHNEDLKRIRENIRRLQTNATFLRSHKNDTEVGMMDIKRWADVDEERYEDEQHMAPPVEKKKSSPRNRWSRLAVRHSSRNDCVACEFNLRFDPQEKKGTTSDGTASPTKPWRTPPSGCYVKSASDSFKSPRRKTSLVPGDVWNNVKSQELFQNRRLQIWHKSESKMLSDGSNSRTSTPNSGLKPKHGTFIPKEDNSYDATTTEYRSMEDRPCHSRLEALKHSESPVVCSDSVILNSATHPRKPRHQSAPFLRPKLKPTQFPSSDDLIAKNKLSRPTSRGDVATPGVAGGEPFCVEGETKGQPLTARSNPEKNQAPKSKSQIKKKMVRETESNAYKMRDFLKKLPQRKPSVARWYTSSGASTTLSEKCRAITRRHSAKKTPIPHFMAVMGGTKVEDFDDEDESDADDDDKDYSHVNTPICPDIYKSPLLVYHSHQRPDPNTDRNSFEELVKCQYLRIPLSILQQQQQKQLRCDSACSAAHSHFAGGGGDVNTQCVQ